MNEKTNKEKTMKDFLEKIIILSKMINAYKDEQTLTEMETGERDPNKRDSISIVIDSDNLFIEFYKKDLGCSIDRESILEIKCYKKSNSARISNLMTFNSETKKNKILLEKLFLSLRRHVKENFEKKFVKNIKIIDDMML